MLVRSRLGVVPVFILALITTLALVFFPRSSETPSSFREKEVQTHTHTHTHSCKHGNISGCHDIPDRVAVTGTSEYQYQTNDWSHDSLPFIMDTPSP